MGSLLPGWDSVHLLPPKDVRDSFDIDEEPKGYFAKLERNRSLRRSSTEAHTSGGPDLQRRSAPLSPGSWSPRGRQSLFGNPSSPVDIRRSTEWGTSDALEVGSAPVLAGRQMKNFKSSSVPQDTTRWWKKLSSGFLNEVYEDEHAEKDKSTGYAPQYAVTGQAFNYRTMSEEAADKTSVELDAEDVADDLRKEQEIPCMNLIEKA